MTVCTIWSRATSSDTIAKHTFYRHDRPYLKVLLFFFFLMTRRPRRSPLFPSTPLFRSGRESGLPPPDAYHPSTYPSAPPDSSRRSFRRPLAWPLARRSPTRRRSLRLVRGTIP